MSVAEARWACRPARVSPRLRPESKRTQNSQIFPSKRAGTQFSLLPKVLGILCPWNSMERLTTSAACKKLRLVLISTPWQPWQGHELFASCFNFRLGWTGACATVSSGDDSDHVLLKLNPWLYPDPAWHCALHNKPVCAGDRHSLYYQTKQMKARHAQFPRNRTWNIFFLNQNRTCPIFPQSDNQFDFLIKADIPSFPEIGNGISTKNLIFFDKGIQINFSSKPVIPCFPKTGHGMHCLPKPGMPNMGLSNEG